MIYEVTNYEVDCDKCGTILEICGTTTASAIAVNVQKN